MSKVTKVIVNNREQVGLVWETNGKEIVILENNSKINFNHNLDVFDTHGNEIGSVDLIEAIGNALIKK